MSGAHSESMAAHKTREEASERTYVVSTLIWDSQTPEPREINFCCLSPQVWYFAMQLKVLRLPPPDEPPALHWDSLHLLQKEVPSSS